MNKLLLIILIFFLLISIGIVLNTITKLVRKRE